jgi:hypothetical protein
MAVYYDLVKKREKDLYIERISKLMDRGAEFTLCIDDLLDNLIDQYKVKGQTATISTPEHDRYIDLTKKGPPIRGRSVAMGLAFDDTAMHDILGEGYLYFNRVQAMQLYALEDLRNIAHIEKSQIEVILKHLGPKIEAEHTNLNKALSHVMSFNLDRYVHSFISRISTLTDNAFYMVAAYNGLEYSRTKDDKKEITMQLNNINKKLSESLRSLRFLNVDGISFISLRNSSMHELPLYSLREYAENSVKQFSLNLVDENNQQHNVYDFLNQFYEQTLNKSEKLIKEMLKDKLTTSKNEKV